MGRRGGGDVGETGWRGGGRKEGFSSNGYGCDCTNLVYSTVVDVNK